MLVSAEGLTLILDIFLPSRTVCILQGSVGYISK